MRLKPHAYAVSVDHGTLTVALDCRMQLMGGIPTYPEHCPRGCGSRLDVVSLAKPWLSCLPHELVEQLCVCAPHELLPLVSCGVSQQCHYCNTWIRQAGLLRLIWGRRWLGPLLWGHYSWFLHREAESWCDPFSKGLLPKPCNPSQKYVLSVYGKLTNGF